MTVTSAKLSAWGRTNSWDLAARPRVSACAPRAPASDALRWQESSGALRPDLVGTVPTISGRWPRDDPGCLDHLRVWVLRVSGLVGLAQGGNRKPPIEVHRVSLSIKFFSNFFRTSRGKPILFPNPDPGVNCLLKSGRQI